MSMFKNLSVRRWIVGLVVAPSLFYTASLHAETQSLKANIDGSSFESDDPGVLLVPVAGSFTISAITKGFSAYPGPAGLSDRLMFGCRGYEAKPHKYSIEDFRSGRCNAGFTKGQSKQTMGKPVAEYESRRDATQQKSFIEITSASGKVIEGKFLVELVPEGSPKGTKAIVAEGTFKAEDRQK